MALAQRRVEQPRSSKNDSEYRAALARIDELIALEDADSVAELEAWANYAEAAALRHSGRARLGAGIALLVVGVLGWGASTAGSVVGIVAFVKQERGACAGGACDTLKSSALWLDVGGGVAEIGGLAGGIPLVISGLQRLEDARRVRVGVAATPTGATVSVAGRF